MNYKQIIPDFIALPPAYFHKPTIELSQALLGCVLVKESKEGLAAGYIVETEAYMGPMDQAAHSYQNKRTKRTEIMFGSPGYVYTYQMHNHCLINVVSGELEKPEAVLIRALEPLAGIDLMKARRGLNDHRKLSDGPGKLTKALAITMKDYGHPLWESPLFILSGETPPSISKGRRIGIDNTGEAKDYPWRFWITGSPFVSRHQKQSE